MTFLDISLQNLILWAMAGIAAGYFVHLYDKRHVAGGMMLTAVFAAVGALMTGYLISFIAAYSMISFNFEAFVVAGVGALLLAFFYRYSFGNQEDILSLPPQRKRKSRKR